ncbi:MAG: sterol desaturase family protein [Pseudomonadota bacterium]
MPSSPDMDQPIRLFSNPAIERLTHVQPETVALLWSFVIGGLGGWAAADPRFSPEPALGFAAAGVLAWTLFEYALHRWLFHWRPRHRPLERLVFLIHGVHHAQPDDGSRVVMPPAASLPLALALWAVAGLVLEAPWRDCFFVGFLAGYLHYDLTHWACHQARPRTRLGRLIKRHHLLHHHVDDAAHFGVGTPVWDHVFGTVLRRPSRGQ